MPVSVSCTAQPTRDTARAESESTATTAQGLTACTTARTISIVSMPVTPSTPGARAHTLRIRSSTLSGSSENKCRVTSV